MQFRKIQRNHATQLPTRLCSIACTWAQRPDPRRPGKQRRVLHTGHARYQRYDRGRWSAPSDFTFRDGRELWAWLRSKATPRTKTWVITHDGRTTLTLAGLWSAMDRRDLQLDIRSRPVNPEVRGKQAPKPSDVLFVWNNPPLIMALRYPSRGGLLVCDLLNWWNCSLDELATFADEERPPGNPDVISLSDHRQAASKQARTILGAFRNIVHFVRDNDFGNFRFTAASQAWHAYRHRFMVHPLYPSADPEMLRLERNAYYGGWTECFWLGRIPETVWHVDVSSLYPSEMAYYRYPVKATRWDFATDWHAGPPPCWLAGSIAEVQIKTEGSTYPARYCGQTVQAYGDFPTTLAGPELRIAADAGHVVAHRRWIQYDLREIFQHWVEELWTMRKDCTNLGSTAEAALVKLLLNSLSGKFAQQSHAYEPRPDMVPPEDWGPFFQVDIRNKATRRFVAIAGNVFEELPRSPKPGTFPAISAFITSHGRVTMKAFASFAGQGNVYYVGTDSLIVNTDGMHALVGRGLVANNKLGYLRVIGKYQSARIFAPNAYLLGSKLVIAGQKRTARALPSGTIVQVDTPSLATMFGDRPGNELPEVERTVGVRNGHSAPGIIKSGWQPRCRLIGTPLRDYEHIPIVADRYLPDDIRAEIDAKAPPVTKQGQLF